MTVTSTIASSLSSARKSNIITLNTSITSCMEKKYYFFIIYKKTIDLSIYPFPCSLVCTARLNTFFGAAIETTEKPDPHVISRCRTRDQYSTWCWVIWDSIFDMTYDLLHPGNNFGCVKLGLELRQQQRQKSIDTILDLG